MIARAASAAASCACLAARATRRPRTSFARRLANMSAAWRDVKFGASGAPGVEVGDASAPAVCLLQEWWGVTLEIKAIGEKLHGVGRNCTRHETAFSVLWQRHQKAHEHITALLGPAAAGARVLACARLHTTR